jgi:hypothetical protein
MGREMLLEHLYPRMQAQSHFHHLWESLAEGRRRLVTFLVIHGGDLGLRELARRGFGGDTTEARRALAPLIECGLVFRDSETSALVGDDIYGLPDLLLRHIELYAHYRGYLGQFLHGLSHEEIERVAREGLRLDLKSTKRDYLRHMVRNALLRPSHLRAHLEELPPEERELFHAALRRGGVCIAGDLIDLGLHRQCDHSKVDLLNHLLRLSGLVFVAAKGANKYADLLMVPKDIVHIVRTGWQEDRRSLSQLDTATAGGRLAPAVILENGAQILRDLVFLTAEVERHGVRRLANGGIGKNDLKRIVPLLSPGKSLKYARFLGLAATELGLLVAVGERWQVSERLCGWIADPPRAYADLVKLWSRTSAWNEEYAEGDVAHADLPITNLIDIAEFRRLVVASLQQLPHGEWVEFRAFADVLLPQVALGVPRRSQRAQGKFNRPPFYIAESIVADSLQWLGVVAIGSDHRSHLESVQSRGNLPVGGPRRRLRQRLATAEDTHLLFRVTDLGIAALRLLTRESGIGNRESNHESRITSDELAFAASQFTVQPNHEILAPPDLALTTLRRLLSFCEVRAVDVMATLALTQSSLRQGIERGESLEAIAELLRSGSNVPLPQTVEHLFAESSRHQSVLFLAAGGGFLLVEDPMIAAEIRAHRRLRPMIRLWAETSGGELRDGAGQHLLVFHPHADLERAAQEIERLGYTVRAESEAAVPTESGKISVVLSERDLFLALAALKFTVGVEEELGIDLSEGRLRTLVKKLRPEGPRFDSLHEYADSLGRRFVRRHGLAVKRRVEQATERHRTQLKKLLGTAPPRGGNRFAFTGPNPATESADVRELIEFAIEHELPVEVKRRRTDGEVVGEELRPELVEGDRLYAYSGAEKAHRYFHLDRILEAHLL